MKKICPTELFTILLSSLEAEEILRESSLNMELVDNIAKEILKEDLTLLQVQAVLIRVWASVLRNGHVTFALKHSQR